LPTEGELDDHHQFAVGHLPPSVDPRPENATFEEFGVAIGDGWVARRPVSSWHVMAMNALTSVALVPPTNFKEWMYSRSIVAPLPDVALQDNEGHSMRIATNKLDANGSQALLHQIPASAFVTPSASDFLNSGVLPGNWGHRFKNAWRMHPYS
jgi:hypothetical protein